PCSAHSWLAGGPTIATPCRVCIAAVGQTTPRMGLRWLSSGGGPVRRWSAMTMAYLVGGVRTPIGRYAGALSAVRPDDLAACPIRALLARYPQVPADAVDEVVLGCANQAGEDNRNVARMALLLAGLP